MELAGIIINLKVLPSDCSRRKARVERPTLEPPPFTASDVAWLIKKFFNGILSVEPSDFVYVRNPSLESLYIASFLKEISEEASFVVISIPSPAPKVRVSVAEPAVTLDCPVVVIVLKTASAAA